MDNESWVMAGIDLEKWKIELEKMDNQTEKQSRVGIKHIAVTEQDIQKEFEGIWGWISSL